MGCAGSKQTYAAESGTEAEYKSAFEEKEKLGQGEFGVVKLVHKRSAPGSDPFAVKVLNKGFVFKDNVLYSPMKPEELKMEIDILRMLGGKKFNLCLDAVYESSSKIYLVSEICAGGEMMEYISENMAEGLRTEEVSRIAYQLLSALDHCARHNVLHRDIKPENIMFKANTRTAELRLIDFGCATLDAAEETGKEHATFAGTAFYISPEMFQKKYTSKTDVFSAGVVMYVLVAGYPAQSLQVAFNLLQKANRDLKTLPGMPEDMPETYYEMLKKMLTYHWKGRKSAGEMLDDEFVAFHRALEKKNPRRSMMRTQSTVLMGTGEKAAAAVGFVRFQRSLTLILAAMLDRGDILSLLSQAKSKESADDTLDSKLGVIKVKDVKSILEKMSKSDCVVAIENQKNSLSYDDYSYDYTLLKPFAKKPDKKHGDNADVDSSTRSAKLSKNNHLSSRMLSSLPSSENFPSRRRLMAKSQSVFM